MAKTNPMKLPSIKLSMQFPFLRLAAFFRLAVSVVSTSSPNISFIVFNLCLRVETVSSSAPEEVIGTEKFVINQHNPAGANSPSLREQIPLNIPLKMYLKLTKCCLDDWTFLITTASAAFLPLKLESRALVQWRRCFLFCYWHCREEAFPMQMLSYIRNWENLLLNSFLYSFAIRWFDAKCLVKACLLWNFKWHLLHL